MPDHLSYLTITAATEATEELYQACQRLVPQLTSNNPPPNHQEPVLLISLEASILFFARHSEFEPGIVGLATLVLNRVPTGLRAYIEDLVVDENARGRRIGEALIRACLERAEQAGASQVMLTSNPGRLVANRLYQRMGFELRKTNVYRYGIRRD